MEEKQSYWKGLLIGLTAGIIILIIVLAVVFTLDLSVRKGNTSSILTKGVESKADLIQRAVDKFYLNDVDKEAMVEGVYSGIIDSLEDPYSVYYTAEQYNSVMESTKGIYYGIGAYLQQNRNTGAVEIVKPMKGSPAEEAGLKAEDIIYKVDGADITGEDLTAIIAKIKGKTGSKVKLTIVREGEHDYLDFDVERRMVEVPTVESEMLSNGIGYIRIQEFDDVTSDQFKETLGNLEGQNMQSLVLDLRDNPGGNLNTVVDIADTMLPEGLIVYQENKAGEKQEYISDEEHKFIKPLVVLINGNSASASEILAGAIKDYGIGTLVGTTTFGKGVVQQIVPLGDDTALKLTISEYFLPSKTSIHEVGVEPDVEVEFDWDAYEVDKSNESDNQLQKAIEILSKK